MGLSGIYLNVKGREARGIVEPGSEAESLAKEIAGKLTGLRDPEEDRVAVHKAYPAFEIYRGPYADQAPDLIAGYAEGWRASWQGARGIVNGRVFEDNTRAWSGDHCIDPELVPGVLIANRKLETGNGGASITDIAPTLLTLFGIPAPGYMDGRSLAES
jgi:predicted AlkP superfamily phosphohydrolase/phosphomutase